MRKIIGYWFITSFIIIIGAQLHKIFAEKFTEGFQSTNNTAVILYGIILKLLPFVIYTLIAFLTVKIYRAGDIGSCSINKKILILPVIFSGIMSIIPIFLNFGVIPSSGSIAVFSAQFVSYTSVSYTHLFPPRLRKKHIHTPHPQENRISR